MADKEEVEEPMQMDDEMIGDAEEGDSDYEDVEGDEDDEGDSGEEDDSDEDEGILGDASVRAKPKTKEEKLKKLGVVVKNGESSKSKKVPKPKKAYLPGMQLKEGENLVCDESAYVTLHTFTTIAPCLSFDIIPDSLGPDRTKFPLTSYVVGGTQAQKSHANHIIVMKLSNVYKTQPKASDDELSSDESDNEGMDESDMNSKKPELNAAVIPHHGCINRLRFNFVGDKPLVATWSELGKVSIWDITTPLRALDSVDLIQEYIKSKDKPKPIFTFKGHRGEGFSMDWSQTMPGVFATGDSSKFIHIWRPNESSWIVDQRPFSAHTASVEDIQWSPNEQHVFASCSVDKSIRIWDARAKPNKGAMITKENAHDSDVNVIHWNRKDPFIASGGDDCALKVWDLRSFGSGESVAEFRHHHKGPICSVEWSPTESSVLTTAGEDDQVAIWDLAVERDPEEKADDDMQDVPPQLMFVHQGQQDIKEVHWHPQIPGTLISTAATGFNIFKPINA
ncbi:Glutamate-rich WD repeat-containing protein 1 [Orchesella cincta]|uniref:Glutamate-rich WD repeat-containing protein 1 n=1 Tax=Orchesella cincta TaxID=48709 RepID=A0A1D2NH97_ORCCI|nr:Glutamate-rich WD repeat-containing protein 1 [Orchesella cincta]